MNIQPYHADYITGYKMFDFEENDKLYTKPTPKADLFEYEKYKLQEYKGEIEVGKSGFHFSFSLDDAMCFKSPFINDKAFPLATKFKPIYYVKIPNEANVKLYTLSKPHFQKFILAATDKLKIEQLYKYSVLTSYITNRYYRTLKVRNAIIETDKFVFDQDNTTMQYSIVNHKNCNIVFDKSFTINKTIFMQHHYTATIDNQSDYSQYVTQTHFDTQKIIEIPKHTTMTIKRFEK